MGVDGKAKRRKDDEGADERDRYSQEGDESCAPALQKDEDDEDDQAEGFQKCIDDFANAGRYRFGCIEWNGVTYAGRKGGRQLFHARSDRGRSFNGIRARQLIDGHHARGRLVVASRKSISLVAKFDAGDVPQVQDRAVRVGTEDNVAKFLWSYQTPLLANRVGELLTFWD